MGETEKWGEAEERWKAQIALRREGKRRVKEILRDEETQRWIKVKERENP